MINTHLYQKNVAILTDYNGKLKLTVCKTLRTKGIELTDKEIEQRLKDKVERGKVHDEKMDNSLSRTKSTVNELAMCNPWDYFITLTLDPEKYDRYNLKEYIKDLGQFIQDYKKKHKIQIKYLLLPEQHKDGAWHIHGLIYGLPLEYLTLFTLQDRLPYKVLANIEKGELIYNWASYAEKFGYCTLSIIKSSEKISSYITKYISKDLGDRKKDLNARLFYSSLKLNRKVELKRGYLNTELTPNYENDYCKINWFDKAIPKDYVMSLIE